MDLKEVDARKCSRCDVQLLGGEVSCPACGQIVSRHEGRASGLEMGLMLLGALAVPVVVFGSKLPTSMASLDIEKCLLAGLYGIPGAIGGWIVGRVLEIARGNR